MTTAEKLTQAKEAYHRLMAGETAVVVVDQNGERIEFSRVSAYRLQAYIATLEAQLAKEQGKPFPGRPAQVWM